jgi:hypothetical protein
MKQRNPEVSQRGESRTSSKKQTPKPNYEIIEGMVIVTCPQGHKNRGQKVSDRQIAYELVCANPSCKKSWSQTLPQITSLEEA